MQFERAIDNLKKGLNNEKIKLAIPWDWVSNSLILMLLEYSDGVTQTIIKSDLQIKWNNEGIEASLSTFNNSNHGDDSEFIYKKPRSLYLSYRKETIPFDSIIESTIQSIDTNDNNSTIHGCSNIITIGDQHYTNQLWVHPKLNQFQNEYFGESPLLSPGRKVRITNITTQYSNIIKDNGNGNTVVNIDKKQQQKKQQVIMPSSLFIFILNSIDELSFSERLKHFKLSNMFNNRQMVPDQNTVLWVSVDKILSLQTENTEIKWGSSIPYDNFLGHSMKQVIQLSELREHWRKDKDQLFNINLIFWDELVGYCRLLKKGDKIRIQGVYYNSQKNINNGGTTITFEILPSSTICVLPISNSPDLTSTTTTTTATELLENRLTIDNIYKIKKSFSLLCKILNVDYTIENQIIYKVYQDNNQNNTINIKRNTSSGCLNNEFIEIGQLVYFRNLHTNNNSNTIHCTDSIDNFTIISNIQGILTSRFIYDEIKFINQLGNYSNSIILLNLIGIDYNYNFLKRVHSICRNEIKDTNNCTIGCGRIIKQNEIINIFNIHYKLSDGNNTSMSISASSIAHYQLLQINEKEFEKLTKEQQNQLIQLTIGKIYYFSITKISGGNNGDQFRIDSCCYNKLN